MLAHFCFVNFWRKQKRTQNQVKIKITFMKRSARNIYLSIDDNRDKSGRPNICVTHFEQSTYCGGGGAAFLAFVFISLFSYWFQWVSGSLCHLVFSHANSVFILARIAKITDFFGDTQNSIDRFSHIVFDNTVKLQNILSFKMWEFWMSIDQLMKMSRKISCYQCFYAVISQQCFRSRSIITKEKF